MLILRFFLPIHDSRWKFLRELLPSYAVFVITASTDVYISVRDGTIEKMMMISQTNFILLESYDCVNIQMYSLLLIT